MYFAAVRESLPRLQDALRGRCEEGPCVMGP
jgi:hypothetical protein